MKISAIIISAALSLLLAVQASAAPDGLTVHILNEGHALVRIENAKKFVLLPIEDAAAESHIRVAVDGQLAKAINLHLAQSKIDYFVPMDISAYAGKNVILDVRADAGRDGRLPASKAAWSSNISLSQTFDKTNVETRWRPVYHHTPEYGWMNDPNGMFYKDGLWHLCFQYGPYGSTWNNMTWGHSVSKDLLHWEAKDPVVEPDALGTIFSGSAVVDSLGSAGYGKDAVLLVYTQNDRSQFQSMAFSVDGGFKFTPYPANPVLAQPYEARDPHIFRHDPSGKWIMILASATRREMDIYSSDDLKSWKKESSFGKGYGSQTGVWECPDLMEVKVRNTGEKKWVLVSNINADGPNGGSATQYFVGEFDGKSFVCDTPKEMIKWMDYGKDHYAAVSWNSAPDGRNTMIAWMSNWQYAHIVPTMQYRSANALPRDVELYKGEDGEYYLSCLPSPEVEAGRGPLKKLGTVSSGKSIDIPEDCIGAFELDLELNCGRAKQSTLVLANGLGEEVKIVFDNVNRNMAIDRTKSGVAGFSKDFNNIINVPLPEGGRHSVRIFIDRTSIEIFEASGRYAVTNLVFPNEPYSILKVQDAKASVKAYSFN